MAPLLGYVYRSSVAGTPGPVKLNAEPARAHTKNPWLGGAARREHGCESAYNQSGQEVAHICLLFRAEGGTKLERVTGDSSSKARSGRRIRQPASGDVHHAREGEAMISPKAPGALDRYVGNRMRVRRLEVGMSQEKLGEALGITFQQVQKYEKGTNRVSISRLHQIAQALETPLSYFYEGGAERSDAQGSFGDPELAGVASNFLKLTEGRVLMQSFVAMTTAQRRQVVDFVRQLSGAADAPARRPRSQKPS
jgi:transcriptional regulator with XRE-family HTH domain